MTHRKPTELADLPAHVVAARGALDVDALRRWTAAAGQRFVLADCADCADKKGVLRQIGREFAFPAWYGANLDALYDCLTDLATANAAGLVVLIERLPRNASFSANDRTALLDVFRDALEPFAEAGVALRVYYS